MLASVIIAQAAEMLQDEPMVTWTEAQHIQRVNSAQRAVAAEIPEASTSTKTMELAAGSEQALAEGESRLLAVLRNMGTDGTTPGNAVRVADKTVLDVFDPGWHQTTATAVVLDYMTDERNPTQFWVNPPADGTAQVEVLVTSVPADITALSNSITIPDKYANAMREYVLYLCFARDSEMTPNYVRAERHLLNFANFLGMQLNNSMRVSPNNPDNQ